MLAIAILLHLGNATTVGVDPVIVIGAAFWMCVAVVVIWGRRERR